jgi:hypothetical protein
MSITLRTRKLKDGRKSLFLDVYEQGKRQFPFMELYLTKDGVANKAIMEIANKIGLPRERSGRLGVPMINRPKVPLSDFTQQFIKSKGISNEKLFNQMLHYLEEFGGADTAVQSINPENRQGRLLRVLERSPARDTCR